MRLVIDDKYELIFTKKVSQLPNGLVLVSVSGMTPYFCEEYPLECLEDNSKMFFIDEGTSWQKCVVQLVIDGVEVNDEYTRYDRLKSGSYEYIFVPNEYFK